MNTEYVEVLQEVKISKFKKVITSLRVCKINCCDFFSCFTTVVQVVLDITTFYMQTYNKFTTTEDQRLKETLRVIHTGVGSPRLLNSAFL